MRTILLSFAFLLAFGSMAQSDSKPVGGTGPLISVDKDLVDYGTIQKSADGNRNFVVTNTGDKPLIISNCQGSCGCTVPKCDTAPILPGQTSVVNVHYDTERVGPFTKTVTVTSNATNTPSLTVNIKGVVEEKAPAEEKPMKAQ
ncbi:MAG: DUF1573 domain-containing protein [Flavobacteriales bacterium]|nr:DUF1573 domain-containing protein [Flavobacteriales bacterium]MBK6893679.1 DUF1573 domain-containing protein [Flavobacteriales bacterium]MBK7248609.1 DUF1573 domain-containing protein [Flavobacteriales bacterium]MBK7287764.1 DUF1573 domain-containing protein [Flavobacteriales bacterium]MBK9059164.1 DUF1573 domain-containing protein [Flavobacteriales bacterium]